MLAKRRINTRNRFNSNGQFTLCHRRFVTSDAERMAESALRGRPARAAWPTRSSQTNKPKSSEEPGPRPAGTPTSRAWRSVESE